MGRLNWGNLFGGRLDVREGSRDGSSTGTAGCASCGSVAGHFAHEVPGAWLPAAVVADSF